ncbi:MAG: DUF6746 family protein [Gammaproteobacteria bacterium]|nr:DUF6746 family protein [Gammaproteobacteria bacterium]
MKALIPTLVLLIAAGTLQADERVDHFEGLPAETLTEAVANFSEYNDRLEAVLNRGDLSPADLAEVHELTYTLENALQKINAEFTALADTLEKVHLASESSEPDTVAARGRAYLETARTVVE